MTADVPVNDALQLWMKVTAASVKRISNLGGYRHEHTIRCGMVAGVPAITAMKQKLAERFAERIVFHSVFVPAYDVEVLEVFDPSVNKWEGIQHVARSHGILPEQIIAIGDDVNDLHMIRNAGLGVAMGNARPEVIAIAKRVIGSNADEGLAAFLDELVETHAVEPLNETEQRDSTEAA
jgi:hydroxymethylpyrimidine pyrophosphatase-like HAD family hydrolase